MCMGRLFVICKIIILCVLTANAYAFLGGAPDIYPPYAPTVETFSNYKTTETATQYGITITEYSDNNQIVFAVTWEGTTRPDMAKLLGPHFFHYQSLLAQAHSLRGGVAQESADLVFFSHAAMNKFSGYAYLPLQIPTGFKTNSLK